MNESTSPFLIACRGGTPERVPVWFMRQAGRSLPEYRKVRERFSLLDICRKPELAAEVTMQPVRRLGVDAAILFSDIMIPLLGMGIELDLVAGVGPVIPDPVRSPKQIRLLRALDPETGVPFVLQTIEMLVGELDVPLIGFAGAPFTLASYLVEGRPSREHAAAKTLMRSDPDDWTTLMDILTESVIAYLRAQVKSGVAAIQLFDSWVGSLDPTDYQRYVMPWVTRILGSLADTVPRIHFGVGTGELLRQMTDAGADVMGVDWRVPLDVARGRSGAGAVQGNLDPTIMLAPWRVVQREALDVLRRGGATGHVFNLGHGVLPETDPDQLTRLVDFIHAWEPDG